MNERYITDKTKKMAKMKGYPIIGRVGKMRITQSELQTWIRRKYRFLIEPCYLKFSIRGSNGFYCRIFKKEHETRRRNFFCHISKSKTYEEALEKGLQVGLNLIK